jgi:cytosolic carboxypeptidase protein 5
VPASHCVKGLLKFLTSKKDSRAALLRKYFVFLVIPMLNPDGVFRGNYRMDIYNQNLNRHYNNPDPALQPAPFAVVQLVKALHNDRRLFFYLDLHAHAARKGSFVYGNALEDIVGQTETQLYARLLSLNCPSFEYDNCNFSRKQMASKDRNE